MSLKGRSIVSLEGLSSVEIERILQVAAQMKNIVISQNKTLDVLRGKSIATLFFEASTRTRSSFELAAKYLGADVVNISKSGSSMTKGESVRDTALTLSAMGVDALVIRDSSEGAAVFVSRAGSPRVAIPPVINAGDGAHAHPSQGLLYGPRTLVPKELEALGCTVDDSMEEALDGADAINVLRIQLERAAGGFIPSLSEYSSLFGLNRRRLALAKPEAIVMHPGPMNRGVEISEDLAYDERSWIQEEVRNGVAIRMAMLYLILTEGKDIEVHN